MSGADFDGLFGTYASAVLAKDAAALLTLYADDFSAFDTWWLAWSLAGTDWRKMNEDWLGSLGSESVRVTFDDVRTIPCDVLSIATATVTFAAVSETGDVLRSMQNRLTWVARQIDGSWKIVHQHTSVPIDESLKGILRKPEQG